MHYGFDESGTFAFADDRFDSSAVAAVACPDSIVDQLEQCVEVLRREASTDELHASTMPDDLLSRTCGLLGGFDICWRAVYTDNRLMPQTQQDDFRRRQVKKIENAIATSTTLADDLERQAEALQMLKRVCHATRVSGAEYLEFLVLFPRLVGDILDASLLAFQDARWASDFERLRFTSDAKLRGKLSMGEKTLAQALPRILANNNEFTLPVPSHWGPRHPFIASHRDGSLETITVSAALREGLRFVDSKESLLVQVADVVVHVAKRATDDPTDKMAQRCYRLLRRRGSCVATPAPVRIFSDRLGSDGNPAWYAHLCA
jgi:Protein of unknown function (DUF3800)